jgi:predicted RNA-binding Zn ribbon-like protein
MLKHRNPRQRENKQEVYDAGFVSGLKAYLNSPSLSIRLRYQGRKMRARCPDKCTILLYDSHRNGRYMECGMGWLGTILFSKVFGMSEQFL